MAGFVFTRSDIYDSNVFLKSPGQFFQHVRADTRRTFDFSQNFSSFVLLILSPS